MSKISEIENKLKGEEGKSRTKKTSISDYFKNLQKNDLLGLPSSCEKSSTKIRNPKKGTNILQKRIK